MTTQLVFHDTHFNITWYAGAIWLRSSEIARALGMSKSDAVSQIYHRNADEFTDAMTLTLKLSVKGFGSGESGRKVRVFSLRGAHLVAMLARTPLAKEFRSWVLDILDRDISPQSPEPIVPRSSRAPRRNIRTRIDELECGERLLIEVDDRGNISHRKLSEDMIVGTLGTLEWMQKKAGFTVIKKELLDQLQRLIRS
ncbi:hypothetical protein BA656_11735 [Salmonella enterica]|nr:hypothetical protein [Salmonella enterica]